MKIQKLGTNGTVLENVSSVSPEASSIGRIGGVVKVQHFWLVLWILTCMYCYFVGAQDINMQRIRGCRF